MKTQMTENQMRMVMTAIRHHFIFNPKDRVLKGLNAELEHYGITDEDVQNYNLLGYINDIIKDFNLK